MVHEIIDGPKGVVFFNSLELAICDIEGPGPFHLILIILINDALNTEKSSFTVLPQEEALPFRCVQLLEWE